MDRDIRERIRDGDADAFAVLFREHARAVYNHCFRLVGDWSVAEDCTSLVFLEAWRLRAKVDLREGSLLPWLLGVATHVLHRRRRVARRHHALMARLPHEHTVADFADDLVGRLADEHRIAVVHQVLRQLPRTDRDVLALCVWAQLDYAAAAEALGGGQRGAAEERRPGVGPPAPERHGLPRRGTRRGDPDQLAERQFQHRSGRRTRLRPGHRHQRRGQ
ncbi:sigma-70 family RNA polymerase sigma factor [Hamadaea sp. NPDC051192]|uniref:RNA polymerase sigma factor n=1 Tax=Hamadaea sp. NPDC051192 TaxID=3154940 RepID=UPI0034195896